MSPTPSPKAVTVEEEFAQAANAGAVSAQASTGQSRRRQSPRASVKRKTPGSDDDSTAARPIAKRPRKSATPPARSAATAAAGSTSFPNEEIFAAARALLSLSYAVVAPAPSPAPIPAPAPTSASASVSAVVSRAQPRIMTPNNRSMLQLATRLRPTGPSGYYYTEAVNAAREAAALAAAKAAPTYGNIRSDAMINGKYNPSDPTTNLTQMKLKSAEAIDDVLAIYGRDPELWDNDVRRLFSAADRRVSREAKEIRDAAKKEEDAAQKASADNARAERLAARRK